MHSKTTEPTSEPTVNARRRLIKGVLAAPTVAVIPSGSAWAAASNLRCVGNQVGKAFPAVRTSAPAVGDTTLWIRLAQLRPSDASLPRTYYVVGALLPVMPKAPGYTLTGSQWQVFNVDSNTDVGGVVMNQQPSGPDATYEVDGDRWAALRFDSLGRLSGVGERGSDVWLTTSCLSSFAFVQG